MQISEALVQVAALFLHLFHVDLVPGGHHLLVGLHVVATLLPLLTLDGFLAFLVQRLIQLNRKIRITISSTNLDLGVFKDVPQILGDTVVGAQILLGEVDSLLV